MPHRRTGKIARLSHEDREEVCRRLRDNRPAREIIAWAATRGVVLREWNVSRWAAGGYQDWLKSQERREDKQARRPTPLAVGQGQEGGNMHEASLEIAASQFCEALTDFDVAGLKDLLREEPKHYVAVVNSLGNVSRWALERKKYRDACQAARAEVAPRPDFNRPLTEEERLAIIDKVDEIMGLKNVRKVST